MNDVAPHAGAWIEAFEPIIEKSTAYENILNLSPRSPR